jgi:hypothetical protein
MNDTIVDIPGIGQVAFPATMSEQEINSAAQRLYNESQQQAQPQAPAAAAQQQQPMPQAQAQPAASSFMGNLAQAAMPEPSTRSMIRGAVEDPINAIRQFFGDEQREKVAQNEKEYQKQRELAGKQGFDGFRLVGNVLSPAVGAGAGAGIKATDFLAKWKTLFSTKTAKGVAAGAGSAVVLPTTTPQEEQDSFFLAKAKDVGFSGLAGGVISKIASALTPQLRPGVSEQLSRGVEVKPGQAYEGVPGWVFRQMESVGFGPSEKTIRQSFTRSSANEVLSSIDQTLPKTVKDGMQASGYVERQIGKFYDDAFDKIGKVVPDAQLANDIGSIVGTARQEMSKRADKIFNASIKANIVDKFKLGAEPAGAVAPLGMRQLPAMDGTKLKEVDKYLKKQIEKYGKGTDADSIALSTAYEDTLNAFRAYTGRVDTTGLIAKADDAWAKLYRFADASQKAFKEAGDFSAEQLAGAAVRQGTTLRAGAGEAPMQKFAQEALDILGAEKDILPAGYRQAVIAGKLTTGAALTFFSPQVAIPILVSSGLTYKAAERLMKNPSALRKAVESAIQKIGPTTAAAMLSQAQNVPEEQ